MAVEGFLQPRSPQILFYEREVLPPAGQIAPHGTDKYLMDLVIKRNRRRDAHIGGQYRPTLELTEAGQAERRQLVMMDLSERASNGLWGEIQSPSTVGPGMAELAVAAAEDSRMPTHGPDHWRRLESVMKGFLHNIPEYQTVQEPEIYDAAFLFPRMHDIDQFFTEKWVLDNDKKLPTKWGHAIAGAVIAYAFTEEYASERGVSPEYAREVMGHAAVMMMKHDEPVKLDEALAGRTPANQFPDGEELYAAFLSNELDLTTLSPAQMINILVTQKGKHEGPNYFIRDDSKFGLHPAVEQALGSRLEAMAEDRRPILEGLTPQKRKSLELAAHAAVAADEMDMIGPEWDAVMRKFNVPKSMDRDFMKTHMTDGELIDVITADRYRYDSKHEPHNDSDITRALWETYHYGKKNDGVIAGNEYGRGLFGDVAIRSTIVFEHILENLMRGNFDPVAEQYNLSTIALGAKMLRKRGFSEEAINNLLSLAAPDDEAGVRDMEQFEAAVVVELEHNRRGDGAQFLRKVRGLDKEREKLTIGLHRKVFDDQGQLRYNEEDIARVKRVTEVILGELFREHNIDETEQSKLRDDIEKRSHSLPYDAYHSTGMGHMKRIFPPRQEDVVAFAA